MEASFNLLGPDFVGIGYAKAGTTRWYDLLLEHPCIVDNQFGKELSDFRELTHAWKKRDLENYWKFFPRESGQLCGEFSPGLLDYPQFFNYRRQAIPNAKIIIILRNPVDRTISHYNHLLRCRLNRHILKFPGRFHRAQKYFNSFVKKLLDLKFINTREFLPRAIENSLLYTRFLRLLQSCPEDQILVLQYEACNQDTVDEINKTYAFLGLDDYTPPDPKRIVYAHPHAVKFGDDERKALVEFFRTDVDAFFELFQSINEYSHLKKELWTDFI